MARETTRRVAARTACTASHGRIILCVTLKQFNPYLKSASGRKVALRLSAQTSSAVEGIRAPFAKGKTAPAGAEAFRAYWKRRVAETER